MVKLIIGIAIYLSLGIVVGQFSGRLLARVYFDNGGRELVLACNGDQDKLSEIVSEAYMRICGLTPERMFRTFIMSYIFWPTMEMRKVDWIRKVESGEIEVF